ncbi:MAG: ABC transporter permease [Ignavibacteria bacterium]|jgi:ABC-type antimicrobial peptide transport system permease subunit
MKKPPRIGRWILSVINRKSNREIVLGDFEEFYNEIRSDRGGLYAAIWFYVQAFKSIPRFLLTSVYWEVVMFKNYLKIALRNILKHKGYSFINIFGLALGMACCIFIYIWVQDELAYDEYNENIKSIYRLEQDYYYSGEAYHIAVTPTASAPYFKEKIPEIVNSCRLKNVEVLVSNGENKFYESNVVGIDSTYLEMFTFEFLKGDKLSALDNPFSIIINDEIAHKYFGDDDPFGKTLTINNKYDFIVTGVFKKFPHNVSYSFAIAFPFSFCKEVGEYSKGWYSNYLTTFIQLASNVNGQDVNRKLTAALREVRPEFTNDYIAAPLSRLHLYSYFGFGHSTGDIQYIYIFSAIAVFVLLIACINFMNLSTAKSANKAKEIGMRKVVGAMRSSLIKQFFGESLLLSFIGLILALGIVALLLGEFNELTGKEVQSSILSNRIFLVGIIVITVVTGILAGIYPALYLSSFKPVLVLKGLKTLRIKNSSLRKILVVTQFSLSVFLIIATIVVYKQITFIKEKDLGYDKENLVYLEMRGDINKNYNVIKSEFEHTQGVASVSAAIDPPYNIGSNAGGAEWDGKDPDQEVLVGINFVDYNYCKTMGIEILEGREFLSEFPADEISDIDTIGGVLVNEEVVKLMGLDNKSAIGARFDFFSQGKIIGVMKDFNFTSVKKVIEPVAMGLVPGNLQYIILRLNPGNLQETISNLEKSWNSVVTDYPFECKFVDSDLDRMYRRETRMLGLLRYFSILAVVIACLGLFGLASFSAEQRTKEIGIRKVLGASEIKLAYLLSREFIVLIAIANVVAWSFAYYGSTKWLDDFAYRINISPVFFLVAGLLSLVIAIVTVSYQAIKAARANPIDSLKYE